MIMELILNLKVLNRVGKLIQGCYTSTKSLMQRGASVIIRFQHISTLSQKKHKLLNAPSKQFMFTCMCLQYEYACVDHLHWVVLWGSDEKAGLFQSLSSLVNHLVTRGRSPTSDVRQSHRRSRGRKLRMAKGSQSVYLRVWGGGGVCLQDGRKENVVCP